MTKTYLLGAHVVRAYLVQSFSSEWLWVTEKEINTSGVTIGPADPTLQGSAVLGGCQNSTLSTADGQKIIEGIKSPTSRRLTDKTIIGVLGGGVKWSRGCKIAPSDQGQRYATAEHLVRQSLQRVDRPLSLIFA